MEIKKSPKADLERGKTLSVLMGFVVGLAVLFVGFEWSTRDVMVVQESDGVADIIAEEEVEITRPENTPPPPPPPPAPVVTEVLNVVEDDVELEQQDILSSEDNQQEAQTAVYTPPAVVEEDGCRGDAGIPRWPGRVVEISGSLYQISGNRSGEWYSGSCSLCVRD